MDLIAKIGWTCIFFGILILPAGAIFDATGFDDRWVNAVIVVATALGVVAVSCFAIYFIVDIWS